MASPKASHGSSQEIEIIPHNISLLSCGKIISYISYILILYLPVFAHVLSLVSFGISANLNRD